MLNHLLIKNYALIEALQMQPSAHLNIITGETGAGKSIMLGAIGLLLGNRADTRALYDESKKCLIEGTFNISEYSALQQLFQENELDYDEETIIRREISPSGKSRAFINDSPVTLDVLRQVGAYLVDVHSQHDTLQLGSNAYQLTLIDAYGKNTDLVSSYQEKYRAWKKLQKQLKSLEDEAQKIRQEADYNSFLLNELEEAKLEGLDQTAAEEHLQELEHAEEIKLKLGGLTHALELDEQLALSPALQTIQLELKTLVKFGENYRQLAERLQSVVLELKDISEELQAQEEAVTVDPEQTQLLQERLSLLYRLQQKHGKTSVEELIELQQQLSEKVYRADHLEEEIKDVAAKMAKAEAAMLDAAAQLSNKRQSQFKPFTDEIQGLLASLGMPEANLELQHQTVAPSPTGTDELNLLFSANKGVKPQTLKAVASGGEFSRLMFCVKYVLADKTALPTIIFDEIDTGISGEIALKMVRMMQQMARNHQVVSISHLPQIAAKGEKHYFVYKDHSAEKTVSRMKLLSEEERVNEIAKMIGGDKPSIVAYQSAKELMVG
jgi:DNA repair protein RecN (Recombination protein N)